MSNEVGGLRRHSENMVYASRIKDIDTTWATQLLQYNEQARAEVLHELSERLVESTQLLYSMLADHCYDLGLLHYALGSSYEQVGQYLTEAARAYFRVFQLRGTQSVFTATLVELPPVAPKYSATNSSELATETLRGEVLRSPLNLPGEVDYSLTNSRIGLRAMFLALISSERDLAHSIAKMVSDPVNATYIGPESEVCTPNEQSVAYAMKWYLLNNSVEASVQLRGLEDPPEYMAHQASVIQALIDRNWSRFLSGLSQLLSEHRRRAEIDSHQVASFLCLPGLALSASALLAGLLGQESLPAREIYLPLPLLRKPTE